jgi:elongation factor 3
MVYLEPPSHSLSLLREALGRPVVDGEEGLDTALAAEEYGEVLAYVASLAASLAGSHDFSPVAWKDTLGCYLTTALPNEAATDEAVEKYRALAEKAYMGDLESESDDDEPGEELMNIRFSLAYGGKILLHQTRLRLRRGHRYGLIGQNGAGKTTLMSAINRGKLEGWPTHLTTEYVDSGSNVDMDYEKRVVMKHLTNSTEKSLEKCTAMLDQLKFTPGMMNGTIGELSGGWQMKLRLAKAVLIDADILLLDEPTNHLDHSTVAWLTNYLNALGDTTVITVSHDTQFMENICTDVIHYEKREGWAHRKLVHYKGKMSEFVEKQPQAKHYFELSTTDLKFKFPEPGRLEGIRTSTQKFLEMENVNFKYPGATENQLTNINLKMNLSSRVVVLGKNGAGKTTLVKMIVGDSYPANPEECKLFIHHNLRVAYVAQHSFHHVEEHLLSSPCAYIQWRFKDAYDKEKLESLTYQISDGEQAAIDAFGLEAIWSRRVRAGTLEYEIKMKNVREKDNKYYSKQALLDMGFDKLLKQTDEKIAAKEAGLDLKACTTSEIQKHLDDFGLEQEYGTYGKIRGLSGGQKVKLVLAAAMWNCPHLLVLDEPTNYLDREALGALSAALNEWGGAVLMISHNQEFYNSVCKEEWLVEDGLVKIEGQSDEREMKAVARKKKIEKEDAPDAVLEKAGGNVNSDGNKYKDAALNFWGASLSKKEYRNYEKAKKKGDVPRMRAELKIPMNKVMPGMEELGDGKEPAPEAK